MKLHYTLFYFTIVSLVFASCGTRKQYAGGKTSTHILTDASSARTSTFSKSKLEDYAALLQVSKSQLNPSLYAFVDDWMGIRHQMGGMSKSGVDCSGFVTLLYDQVYRKSLPRTSRDMESAVEHKSEKKLKEGDLVFFSFGGRSIDHVGVYLQNDKFVHVSTKKGVIISDLNDNWYQKVYESGGSAN